MVNPILTILIPTYQGAQHLRPTLDSVLGQLSNRVDFLICDDGSTDETPRILETLVRDRADVRVELFPENQGMDRHFIRAVSLAKGTFIWVLGQDDLLKPGAVAKALELIEKYPKLGFIYFNFSQNSHDLSDVYGESLLDEVSLTGKVTWGEELFFPSPEAYFARFRQVPYFCSSKVFRKEYWFQPGIEEYAGTHFIMPAMLLLNMRRFPSVIVTTPYVIGRIPNNKWQSKGQSLFEVTVGYLEMCEMVFRDQRNPIPRHLHQAHRAKFLKDFFPLVRATKNRGMKTSAKILEKLRFVYGAGVVFFLYVKPIYFLPIPLMHLISRIAFLPKLFLFRAERGQP